jgi:hypothetical protein
MARIRGSKRQTENRWNRWSRSNRSSRKKRRSRLLSFILCPLHSAWCLVPSCFLTSDVCPLSSVVFPFLAFLACLASERSELPATTYCASSNAGTSFGIIIAALLFATFQERASGYEASVPDLPQVSNEYLAQNKSKRSPPLRGRD